MTGLLFRISGLPRLVAEYPFRDGQAPAGEMLHKQTVKVGPVRYRRCVTVNISTQGLYLAVLPPLGKQATVLIPWIDITSVEVATLYGRKAARLLIGQGELASITVYSELFRSMQPHLRSNVQVDEQSNH
jgi:hypothetical protein